MIVGSILATSSPTLVHARHLAGYLKRADGYYTRVVYANLNMLQQSIFDPVVALAREIIFNGRFGGPHSLMPQSLPYV